MRQRLILLPLLAAALCRAQAQSPDAERQCLVHLKQISAAAQLYAADHEGKLPKAANFKVFNQQIQPYLRNSKTAVCPSTGKAYLFNTALSGAAVKSRPNPSATPLVRDGVPHADGSMGLGYLDGHARRLPAGRVQQQAGSAAWR